MRTSEYHSHQAIESEKGTTSLLREDSSGPKDDPHGASDATPSSPRGLCSSISCFRASNAYFVPAA